MTRKGKWVAKRFLRLPEVERRVGLKTSLIYEMMRDGEFPKPYSLGRRAVGWLEDEIDGWMDQRIAARDTEKGRRAAA